MDEPVTVLVEDLKPRQKVTLATCLPEAADAFVAHAHYEADDVGKVDVTSQPALGGSYSGTESMGLFWSLLAEDGSKPGTRLRALDVTSPHHVTLSVLSGHVDANHRSFHGGPVLAQAVTERHYMGSDVIRVPVHHGRLRGTLFIPNNGVGRHPGVLDLYGSMGGLPEYRAAMLASRGITTLILAYFCHQDLPNSPYDDLPLEYFEEAIEFLSSHDNVSPGGVGILGVSLGAIIATELAITNKQVRAIALIGVFENNPFSILTRNGERIPYTKINPSLIRQIPEGLDYKEALNRVTSDWDDATIPIEKATHTAIMFIHGSYDMASDPRCILRMTSRLLDHGHHNFSISMYQGAGHQIDPPYMPFINSYWHRIVGANIVIGGEASMQNRAQESAWRDVQTFFKTRLAG